MSGELTGKKIAFLCANSGVAQEELTRPWQAILDAGAEPTLIAPEPGTVQAVDRQYKDADTFPVDKTVAEAEHHDYDALVLPGGLANPDLLRLNSEAVTFTGAFTYAKKPIGAIGHAAWTLAEAGVLGGKGVTSWPSLRTDLVNAGARGWFDEQFHVCVANGWTLVSSRSPDDLDFFCPNLVAEFAKVLT